MNNQDPYPQAAKVPPIPDPGDPMSGLDPWDEEQARQLARQERLELTAEHLYLLKALRDCYRDNPHLTAREALGCLELNMLGSDAKQHLYQLFPGGPVRQATHLAGLPMPAGAENPGFGNVM